MNHCVQELSYYSQQGKQKEQMLLYYVVKLSSDPTPYFSIDLDMWRFCNKAAFYDLPIKM